MQAVRQESERAMTECHHYNIVRFYENDSIGTRVIRRGLTLEEAQAHCSDPETSSSTCTNAAGKARTRKIGRWFDGYEETK
jgi:hypothetical protein